MADILAFSNKIIDIILKNFLIIRGESGFVIILQVKKNGYKLIIRISF